MTFINGNKVDTPASPRSILFVGNGRVSLIKMPRPHPSGLVNVLHNSEKMSGTQSPGQPSLLHSRPSKN